MNKYGINVDFNGKYTFEPQGCSKCNNTGFYGRTGVFEVLEIKEDMKELIINNASTIEIRKQAIKDGYRPLIVDGIGKVLDGEITLDELNRKIIFY